MLTVVCVLRSGGEYRPEHVIQLRDAIDCWLTLPRKFVCLTDIPSADYKTILLKHDWPGWWSKLELFREGLLSGPVFYIDLDTLIVSSINDLVLGHRFTALRNVWVDHPHPRIGSGVMAWDTRKAPELAELYRIFSADPARYMRQPRTADNLGDQGFIQRHTPIAPERWQDKFPGRFVSWRRHCTKAIPRGASIICFGGPVRPWTVSETALDHLAGVEG